MDTVSLNLLSLQPYIRQRALFYPIYLFQLVATHTLPVLPSKLGVKSLQMCIIQAGTETDGFCIGHVYFLLARLKHVICCHTCPCEILARNQFDFQCQAAFFNVSR